MALKKLSVEVGMNTSAFQQGLKGMQSGLNGMQSGMKAMQGKTSALSSGLQTMGAKGSSAMSALKVGALATAAALTGLVFVLKKLLDGLLVLQRAFASFESSVYRVNNLFGESSKYIQYFAENTAKAFGMSESAAYRYAATYGGLFRSITKDTEENAKVTIAMLKASAVIASKTGRTMEDVMERIRSGLLGNTEAIEDLEIQVNVAMLEMTDAFKKIANGRSWEQLTFYEQQQIRLLAILEQSHKQFGDEVYKGGAFALQALSSAFEDLKTTASAFVDAALRPIIQGLTQLVQGATRALATLAALFGLELDFNDKSTSGTAAQTAAQNDLTDAVEETTKAKQKLAGFDEINTLPSASGAAAGVGAGESPFAAVENPEYAITEPDTSWIDKVKNKLASIKDAMQPLFDFFKGLGEAVMKAYALIKPEIDKLIATFKRIWEELRPFLEPVIEFIMGSLLPFLQKAIVVIGEIIAAIISLVDLFINVIWDKLLKPFLATLIIHILPVLIDLGTKVLEIIETVTEEIKKIIELFVNDVAPLLDGWVKIWQDTWGIIHEKWETYGKPIFDGLQEAIKNASENFQNAWTTVIKPALDNLMKNIDWLWSEHIKPLVDNIGDFVGKLAIFALDIYNNFISPIISWVTKLFGPQISSTIQFIGNIFTTVFSIVADVLNTFVSVLTGVIDFISGVFSGDWEKAWQGVQDIFGAMFDGMVSIGKGALNIIIDLINGITSGISSIAEGLSNIPGMSWAASIDIPRIPKLAHGGIVEQPTLATIGDAGAEAIVPLERNTGWIDVLADKLAARTAGAQAAGVPGDVYVYIGNDELEAYVVRATRSQQRKSNGRV